MPTDPLLPKALLKVSEAVGSAMQDIRQQARAAKVLVDDQDRRQAIKEHVASVATWARTVGFHGLFRDKELADVFTAVSFAIGMQRPARDERPEETLTLEEVHARTEHLVILGQPGAGKTTALQRIAQFASAQWDRRGGAPPVLVCLRDLRGGHSLADAILHTVGITVTTPPGMDAATRALWMQRAACRAIAAMGAVLLIDGLDETPELRRETVEADLGAIALHAGPHRVIVTCRVQDYRRHHKAIERVTLLPLTPAQIEEFAGRWLGAAAAPAFVAAVRHSPYAATGVVPLTLAHLAALYESHGSLPERPIEVYEQIVSLLVSRWDDQRNVRRTSRWLGFSWPKKQRCLAAIAYHLICGGRRGSFRTADLREIADDVRREVGLDAVEMADLLAELDSHTGIVHVLGNDRYQYAHLVIQEFLAAQHAQRLRDPIVDLVPYHPNELALVVAMATNPNHFLEDVLTCVLQKQDVREVPDLLHERFTKPFINRLAIEQPGWTVDARFGWTLLAFRALLEHNEGTRFSPHDIWRFGFASLMYLFVGDRAGRSIAQALQQATVAHGELRGAVSVMARPDADLPELLAQRLAEGPLVVSMPISEQYRVLSVAQLDALYPEGVPTDD